MSGDILKKLGQAARDGGLGNQYIFISEWCDGSKPCALNDAASETHGHWRGGQSINLTEFILGLADEMGRLQAENIRLSDELSQAKTRLDRSTDWYQQRFNRLRRWVKEEVEPLSAETAHRYFGICANGSPAPHESADWTGTMHNLNVQLDSANAKIKKLQEQLDWQVTCNKALLESQECLAGEVRKLQSDNSMGNIQPKDNS